MFDENKINCSPILRSSIDIEADSLSQEILKLDNFFYDSSNYPRSLGVNITPNEKGSQQTCQRLYQPSSLNNSCHIGVSGWFNLDLIAARHTHRGIIFDSNPEVSLFFDHTFKSILISENREIFVSKMKECIAQYCYTSLKNIPEYSLKHAFRWAPNFLNPENFTAEGEIDIHANSHEGWLKDENSYQFIRQLVLKNKIVVLTADITHDHIFKKIRYLLDQNHITIDTLYLSNVPNYISSENKDSFFRTISYLSGQNTWLIDSGTPNDSELRQSIILCAELESTKKKWNRWFSSRSNEISSGLSNKATNTHKLFTIVGLIALPILAAMLIGNMYYHCMMVALIILPILAALLIGCLYYPFEQSYNLKSAKFVY